jgi:hypothetical protein
MRVQEPTRYCFNELANASEGPDAMRRQDSAGEAMLEVSSIRLAARIA